MLSVNKVNIYNLFLPCYYCGDDPVGLISLPDNKDRVAVCFSCGVKVANSKDANVETINEEK